MSGRIFVNLKTRVSAPLPDFELEGLNLDVMSWFPNNILSYGEYKIPLYQLSPYYLKTGDGYLFENLWQAAKIYPSVTKQNLIYGTKTTWKHDSEVHLIESINENGTISQIITEEYWSWREKLLKNPYPVRYPNGFHGRHKCKCALWFDGEKWLRLGYIESRKLIYGKEYIKLIRQSEAFRMLKVIYDQGTNLQICEVDIRPSEINLEVLRAEINNDKKACGHGYFLACALMCSEEEIDELLS